MTLKTKLFGKKIEEEALEKLLGVMGENQRILSTSLEKWYTGEVNGKCALTPVNDGIAVDLYIFRTDIHNVDGTISADHEAMASGVKKIRKVERFHRKGKIPYELGDK